ncbi:hypothetical protein N7495_004495 [Penicillium taxi]|uniref:uncharacterized protein n=1 Tax=Penicillium taxi TaxID=168475 RepID=UPI0025456902|nr:uncharacterized protein N7495_004495 [Penicillium taxi]KAJ5899751.1 hypothetical protein N7495_004495 [Penicillium taxi]
MSPWLLACLVGLVGSAFGATPEEWRTRSIYFLLTDRFARTDGSTTATCVSKMGQYCGGSWQGIIDQLDYIQGMGFTAIWISPVTKQVEGDTSDGTAYHGYWQQDIYDVNSNFGTADDLKDLATAVHDRGMYLMVDVVANHMGYKGAGTDMDTSVFPQFDDPAFYHSHCEVDNYDNQTNVQDCWLGDNTIALADLKTESQAVQDIWYKWVGSLVSNYSIDGLRVDTVKHVNKDFWPGYNSAAGVYCIGEVLEGATSYTCPYQEVMDGLLNYPLYFPLVRAFKSTTGDIGALADMIDNVKSTCSDSTLLGTFSENHDNPRFASYTDDMSLAKNAVAFTIMADGIPIIYAGQEQHYSGSNDPYNREATWLSKYNTTSELYQLVAVVNAVRNHAIYASSDYITYKNYPIYQDDSTLAMRKGYNGTQTVTVLSNLGATGSEYTLALPSTGFTAGIYVTEIFTCSSIQVDDNGDVAVPMASGEPRILYPSSVLDGSGLCT